MRGLLVVSALLLAGCEPVNYVEAPKPAEVDPQFIVERRVRDKSGPVPTVYVIRDKVNGNLLYVTPGSGIAVIEEN